MSSTAPGCSKVQIRGILYHSGIGHLCFSFQDALGPRCLFSVVLVLGSLNAAVSKVVLEIWVSSALTAALAEDLKSVISAKASEEVVLLEVFSQGLTFSGLSLSGILGPWTSTEADR